MKERIFTTKEQGRVLVEAGLHISTASGFRDKHLDQLHSMEDNAGRIGLIEAMKPIPVYSSPCYSINDNRSPEEKHEEEMRFCKDLNDLRCEMLIDMAKKIEVYLSHN